MFVHQYNSESPTRKIFVQLPLNWRETFICDEVVAEYFGIKTKGINLRKMKYTWIRQLYWQNNLPSQDGHVPIPGTRDYVILHGKGDFEDVMKLRILRYKIILGCLSGSNRTVSIFIK